MGSILPVTHHTYQNYQQRMSKNKKSYHYIDAPHKVTFYKIKDTHDFVEEKSFHKLLKEKDKELNHIIADEKVELIGKGKMINKRI